MTESRISDLYRRHPQVLQAVLDFNFNLAGNLHPSRRCDFFEDKVPTNVWNQARVHARLSALMLKSSGLGDQTFYDTAFPFFSLVSLSSPRLLKLARHAGAIAVGSQIRSSLARSQVLDWKSQLGEEAFKFAMKSSQLLPAVKLPKVAPGIAAAEKMGYGLIYSTVQDAPDAVRLRVQLKIPREAEQITTEKRQAAHIVQSVITTLEPKWHSLFAELKN
jgi:hypothetical protein